MFWVAIAAPFGERNFVRKFETRSLPNSLAASPRGVAFYIADPITSECGPSSNCNRPTESAGDDEADD